MWLTYAGVAFGLIAMVLDVLIAGVLRDELIAADRVMRQMEITNTGEDPGNGNMAEFALGWAIGALVLLLLPARSGSRHVSTLGQN